ncbi:HAMP domain-containing sensor histidine kinase [uncultured Pelagimonas sp.]|uniref:sensor histidine kinase n=1 Tax=uncultured Pelagimonas sp. TaxID=1618102 RepID=UPI00261E129C|nr:HAMP domain-containing sensor histidine kinase [uncultured Pelagimonas sp.]
MSQAFVPPTSVEIRAEEARLLRERAHGSARSVFILIALIAISLASVHLYREALIWTCLASVMVAITILYARFWLHSDDTPKQVDQYLIGHIVISACTGLLWAKGAIELASPTSELQTFLAGLFLTSITAGGVMAGTVYRPGYLAIAVCSLLPFGLYLLFTMDGVLRIYGGFILFYLSFCFTTNKTASQKTRDALAAKLVSRQAEKALEEFAEAAKHQRAAKRSLEAIRHDMAQPLLALRNFLAEMDRQASSPEQAVLVRQIRLALISQEALVEELSNVEQPAQEPAQAEIDVADLVAQLDDEYRPQFAAEGCDFTVDVDLDVIESDRPKLERILRNFLSNAVKYGASGGAVRLTVYATDTESLWQVTDQGPGMTQDQIQAVRQGEDLPATHSGRGLGLGIVRQLAHELDGTFEIKSSETKGTQVTLRLPRVQIETPQEQAFVLVVGQETLPTMGAWADLVSSWVWKFAHADTCEDAAEAITVLGQVPDLIVLDPAAGQTFSPEEIGDLRQFAPTTRLLRAANTDAQSWTQDTIELPRREIELRRALERSLQNNANSRAL